jgi:3-methyladenine DNA glycosylase AlkD
MNKRIASLLAELSALASPEVRDSQTRFGITSIHRLGISVPILHRFAKQCGKDHDLALALWQTGLFEARVVAALIDVPAEVTKKQMEQWAKDFDSWGIVDTCCGYLFDKTDHAWEKAVTWATRKPEFVKRASFALMAYLAVHQKQVADTTFHRFFPLIEQAAADDRLYVRKAVNWALRQLGKRSPALHPLAVATAQRIQHQGTKSARWIAADALRELQGDQVKKRLEIL